MILAVMEFTSWIYTLFLGLVVTSYWLLRDSRFQNPLLLLASYVFYGWVHPWFCTLIAASTVLDYQCGLGMERTPKRKKLFLTLSLLGNLGLLATFKYFNFFLENVQALGLGSEWRGLSLVLPVGISFYTFQTLSYSIDCYRGEMRPCRNFVDFALFVSFFPQLVAGPIERATRLIPQLQAERRWNSDYLRAAASLFLIGYFKKLVVADNVCVWVDRVFLLQQPSPWLLFVGSLGFAIQIYADFSAYTDIARGSAKLLGIDLMENFRSPFMAISPSDFWRRWHISFSSWIRDYLYIPLGGSRVDGLWKAGWVLLVSMGLSGLWHGAAWHFVAWGVYHAAILFIYRALGFSAKWDPSGWRRVLAWASFQTLSILGWSLFRCQSLGWLMKAFFLPTIGLGSMELVAAGSLLLVFLFYSCFWLARHALCRWAGDRVWLWTAWQWATASAIFLLANRVPQQFIYFQF